MTDDRLFSAEFDVVSSFPVDAPTNRPLTFDAERYRAHLSGMNLSAGQETALLEALWSVMRTFVEAGLDPKFCGQVAAAFNGVSGGVETGAKVIDSKALEIPNERELKHDG